VENIPRTKEKGGKNRAVIKKTRTENDSHRKSRGKTTPLLSSLTTKERDLTEGAEGKVANDYLDKKSVEARVDGDCNCKVAAASTARGENRRRCQLCCRKTNLNLTLPRNTDKTEGGLDVGRKETEKQLQERQAPG